jgi:DNA-directed RNA polymerase subunit RPC12/RpoP
LGGGKDMSDKEALHGLDCPNCGGMVPIPEGQTVVKCPFCDVRSLVRGERGLLRYQVPLQIDRQAAESAVRRFLTGNRAIARQAAKKSRIAEAIVVYLPFWAIWTRVFGWVFGEKKVGSGDDSRYEPREVKTSEEMSWNAAAADVAEFGVEFVDVEAHDLDPFDVANLHATGMVFEPMGSWSEAKTESERYFEGRVGDLANLDRISQVFTRFLHNRVGLVYFPLWLFRYQFRNRTYQVVVDGTSGKVLYGKAPGDTIYRAAVLVGGMALGAILALDVSAVVFWFAIQGEGDNPFILIIFGFGLIALGLRFMVRSYRRFRHGEIYEYRQRRPSRSRSFFGIPNRVWKMLR